LKHGKGKKMTVYILQAQGLGDNEFAFYNTGVYSTLEFAQNAEQNLIRESHDDGLTDIATNIEMLELDC
jgi:hypothetical protein